MKKNYKIIALVLIIIIICSIPFIIIFDRYDSSEVDNSNNNINQKEITSIEISKMPNKIKYKEGEIFDKTGMIIKAIYNDKTESNIDGYIIDKTQPLTIYDSQITISYKDKTTNIFISIINDEDIEIYPNPSKEQYTLETLEGITRFEIEDSDISNWIISNQNEQNKIIERNDASGGKFLSGIEENNQNERKLIFNLNLKFNSEIIMIASYSQTEKWKNFDIDLSSIYVFLIDENKNIEIDGDKILKKREDTTRWQKIKYKSYSLPKGKHTLSIKVSPNSQTGTPNIDYIDFQTKEIEEIPIDPITDEIPSNDFHTLLQYKYIIDENPENIFNYAYGVEDLSRPKGNELDFSDSVKDSNSYVLQISSSNNFDNSNTYIIKNLTEKKYILKNLKLGEKLFYRGAINENELPSCKIYELTVNELGPRNLDIPGVDNSRDIGGYKTTLVNGGKIKQGLFYRSAEINNIKEEGKKILTQDLGIKVEIDLRDSYYNTGPYVDGVKYYPIPIPSGSEKIRFEKFEEEYIKIFNLIAESDKNPIILHCMAGADRTGIMSFALMTLLGCEYNDIARDYCFTNFGVQGKRDINSEFKYWWRKLDKYEGETKADKCKSWLMSKGIEESKLEHIRAIFIDNYKENTSFNNSN